MLDAHMDELGGMVRRVTPTGFLSMQMLGGWLDQALPDQRWIIIGRNGPVHAAEMARSLGMAKAIIPRGSGSIRSARMKASRKKPAGTRARMTPAARPPISVRAAGVASADVLRLHRAPGHLRQHRGE